jgi:hypothetical protein
MTPRPAADLAAARGFRPTDARQGPVVLRAAAEIGKAAVSSFRVVPPHPNCRCPLLPAFEAFRAAPRA